MPRDGIPNDLLVTIEDHIAEIISARSAIIDLEVFIHGQHRRGAIDAQQMETMLGKCDTVRIGIIRGQHYAKKVRGKPEFICS